MPSERELVLAETDLAARLTRQPLGYKTPEQWNGYIPPYVVPAYDRHVRNDSPQRVHLVAIVREALARKYGAETAKRWLAEANSDRWTGTWMPSPIEAIHRAARLFDDTIPTYLKD